jgi:hypothetical protein
MPLKNCYWTTTYLKQQSPGSNWTGPGYYCEYYETYATYPNNDTIISGKRYIKFYRKFISDYTTGTSCTFTYSPTYSDGYIYGIRQDTAAQKIYAMPYNQTAEVLLYDFNYVAGDSLRTTMGVFSLAPPCNPSNKRIVNSVSTVTLGDGLGHRIYQLKPYPAGCSGPYPFNDTIIEGVGNEIGVYEMLKVNPQISPWQTTVTGVVANCLVVNHTTVIYFRGAANCNYPLNVAGIKPNKSLEIFPNPSNGYLNIVNENNIKKISIVNSLGAEVLNIPFDTQKINVNSLAPGMYYLIIEKSDGRTTTKFVRE